MAYRDAWARRGLVVPIVLGARLLSLTVIAPVLGLALQAAVLVSGQAALTDQDIAYFILSPVGFPLFLLVLGLLLIGTIIGFSALTMDLQTQGHHGIRAVPRALRQILARLPGLLRYACELVLRILLLVAPFALAGVELAMGLLGDFDINYYLSVRPPEAVIFAVSVAVLALVGGGLLLSKLLGWALSLHFVLFGQYRAGPAFAASKEAMDGKRGEMIRTLVAWYLLRALLLLIVAGVFVGFLKSVPSLVGDGFRPRLIAALLVVGLWAVVGFCVQAISVGALARLLNDNYEGPQQKDATTDLSAPALFSLRWIAVGAGFLAVFGLVAGANLTRGVQTQQDVLVIGHRGAAGDFPENTIAAITGAVEAGADWVEIDVQESADGEVVVIHDSDFMKLASVSTKVWDATSDDLAEIDIGSWFDPAFADQRVPTLAEVLEITRDRARLLIELKYYGHDEALEARTAEIVAAAGLEDQVAVMSLKYPAVQKMAGLRPDWPAGVLAATALGDLSRLNADFIAVNTSLATPRLLRRAKSQGKQVFVWTVNDPLEMSAMISLGVDGLITDAPATAKEVIARHAELSPQSRMFLLFLERFGLTDRLNVTEAGQS